MGLHRQHDSWRHEAAWDALSPEFGIVGDRVDYLRSTIQQCYVTIFLYANTSLVFVLKIVSRGLANEAEDIIQTLRAKRFYTDCPHCEKNILLKDAGLFYYEDFSSRGQKLYQQKLQEIEDQENRLRDARKQISRTSEVGAKAVNIGFLLERLAPSMRGFPFVRNDCRSLFEPIDYVIFDGLTRNGSVSKIVFADIKTGDATLKANQREIRRLVEHKHVLFDTYGAGSK